MNQESGRKSNPLFVSPLERGRETGRRNKNLIRFTRVFLLFWLAFMIVSTLAYLPWRFIQVEDVSALTAGPNSAGTDAGNTNCGNDNWTWNNTGTPGGTNANDTTYVNQNTNRWDNGDVSDELDVSNFSFSGISGTVTGITVEVLAWTTTGSANYTNVELYTTDPASPAGDNKTVGSLPTSDPGSTYQSFGASDDDWNAGITADNLNNNNFGVRFCWTATSDNTEANIDHVKVTIEYSGATATLTQNDFEFWYDNDAANPVEVIGTPDLAENTVLNAIPVHNEAPTSTRQIRIRINMTVGGANISADTSTLKLQYATSTLSSLACASESTSNFKDVEANASTAAWKFTGSTTVTDGASITPSITGSDAGKYARTNTITNPAANQNDDIEFDWHIQKDINANGATYCFRMVTSAADLDGYNSDSYPRITTAPGSENILRHGNFFDQAEEKGFYWAN